MTAIAGVVLLAGLGSALVLNNPDQEAYEGFATQALIDYAEQNLCKKVPFLGAAQCKSVIVSNQAEVRKLITEGTHRQNYIFFSIYATDLSPALFCLPLLQLSCRPITLRR